MSEAGGDAAMAPAGSATAPSSAAVAPTQSMTSAASFSSASPSPRYVMRSRAASSNASSLSSSSSLFPLAASPDMVRAVQKDESCLYSLSDMLREASTEVLGSMTTHRWSAEIEMLARAAYYGATSLQGKQTLGEEYCDLMQVTESNAVPPPRARRSGRRPAMRSSSETERPTMQAEAQALSSPDIPPQPFPAVAEQSASATPTTIPAAASPLFSWARYSSFHPLSFPHRIALFICQVIVPYVHDVLRRSPRRLMFNEDALARPVLRPQLLGEPHGSLRERVDEREIEDELEEDEEEDEMKEDDGDVPRREDAAIASNANNHALTDRWYHFRLRFGYLLSLIRWRLRLVWNDLIDFVLMWDYTQWNHVQRLHLAMFYLLGHYLQLSKRVVGVRYAQLRQFDVPRPSYRLFGILLFTQATCGFLSVWRRGMAARVDEDANAAIDIGPMNLGMDSASGLYSLAEAEEREEEQVEHQQEEAMRERMTLERGATAMSMSGSSSMSPSTQRIHTLHDKESVSDEDDEEAVNCTLCLCPREDTTATDCGHLFCWSCISECLTNKPECPLCRQPCSLNTLLLLAHYK